MTNINHYRDAAGNETLNLWRVTLHEEAGDKFTIVFDCWAEDADHAAEQASNAYPAAVILNTTKEQ